MYRLSRSSRATGPKIRVPLGFLESGVSRTTALSSKRMYDPSGRRRSLAVRDDGAHDLALLHAAARQRSLIVPTTVSPMLAYRRADPPSTRITRAPWLRCCPRHGNGSPAGSFGALHDLDQPPPLRLGEWSRLHDAHRSPT